MANLVVCCDGTWKSIDDRIDGVPLLTNVAKLYNLLREVDEDGAPQLKYYHPGVGTNVGWWKRQLGGGMGYGLNHSIKSAYKWLAENYTGNERIFLFGFSRGAFCVRSLAGMIALADLPEFSQATSERDKWAEVEKRFRFYQKYGETERSNQNSHARQSLGVKRVSAIHFLGVWDTVGSLGIPTELGSLRWLTDPRKYKFHDTDLSDFVRCARHALAMDEMRHSFFPTLWTNLDERADVKQTWFPGSHCDVGGGYLETELSDGPLAWMMKEAGDQGLSFRNGALAQINPRSDGVRHDSWEGTYRRLRSVPRTIPWLQSHERDQQQGDAQERVTQGGHRQNFHTSVLQRHNSPPIEEAHYWRSRRLEADGEAEVQAYIYAHRHWNDTGLFVKAGERYQFTASGEWQDNSILCDGAGAVSDRFQIKVFWFLAEVWALAVSVLRFVFDYCAFAIKFCYACFPLPVTKTNIRKFKLKWSNLQRPRPQATLGIRRKRDVPWFSLVGVVANWVPPKDWDGPVQHDEFLIGNETEKKFDRDGYIYCYANDLWAFYGNNRGSLRLTIKRIL